MKLIIEYNEYEAFVDEKKRLKEDWTAYFDEEPSDKDIESHLENDTSYLDWYYEDVSNIISEMLLKKGNFWKIVVENFGWRNLFGVGYFELQSFSDIMRKVLPNTNLNFKIYNNGKGFAIQCWHHDSPMGEWYYANPIKESTYYKNVNN